MNEWKEYTVQDLIDQGMLAEPMDGNHGSIHPKSSDYVSEGVPFIMANDLVNGVVDLINCSFISEKQAKMLKKGFAHPNDVLLTHKATIGRTAIVPNKYETIILTPQVTYYRVLKGIDNRYLKYYFDSDFFQNTLRNWAGSGSTRAYIGITAQRKLPIILPPLNVQTKIATVLSLLDEKISLNIAINENLEQQAQAIFKAWFVDFEPFGGVMPDDWQDISVYDLADYINGTAFKKAEYGDSGFPIIKIAELKSGITDSTQYCCVRKDDKYYIDDRDILFSWSGNPDTSIDTFLWSRGKAILNQHTFRVVSKYNAPAFTYFLLKYLKPQFAHIASNKQTTGLGHVTVADLKRLQFCSNIATINEFEVLAAPIFNAIFAIYKENQHLADLRDTLLPKLMNGEIDVSAVEI